MNILFKSYSTLKSKKKKGFTLIELVVVIATMAILALLLVPNLSAYTSKANTAKVRANMRNIYTASELVNQTEGDLNLDEIISFSNAKSGTVEISSNFVDKTYTVSRNSETGKIEVKYTDEEIGNHIFPDNGGSLANGPIDESGNADSVEAINPDDAKWVEKGNWGTNGKWVVDKDGNAVIYAIDASKPIAFHDMKTENAKLPTATMTTLTFQDKVQGDTNSSMADPFGYYRFTNLKTINNLGTNVDTSNVIDMEGMFYNSKLTSVGDLSQWNTSNVRGVSNMFAQSKLTSVGDLSQWNTSNVTSMRSMFELSQLTSVGDLSQWNTSNVKSMSYMFYYSKLTSVGDLSHWNTSNVTNMSVMFQRSQLTSVGDLSQWNTSNVTNMGGMFNYSNLTRPSSW